MHRHLPAALAAALVAWLAPQSAWAQGASENRYRGELGGGLFAGSELARGNGATLLPAPYVYGTWGRLFGRIDTFGVKTLPLGGGHLELVGRVSTEGVDTDEAPLRGLRERRSPVPVGLGTVQVTPIGAFFLHALHDLRSGGALLEATWAGRYDVGPVSLYPLLGVEHRSRSYVRHLYGIDAAESAASGLASYAPGASTLPMAGLAASWSFAGPWSLQLQWRLRRLDGAIADSPVVAGRSLHSGHVAVTYRFD